MPVTYGLLSTYSPTQCGLATFSAALVDSLRTPNDVVGVVSIVDQPERSPAPEVCHEWVRGNASGAAAAAAALNRHDVAIIQLEYGIFPGRDGVDVLDVVRLLRIPAIVVLHTVLITPTSHQRAILEELVRICDCVVTMTQTARRRLIELYAVRPGLIRVIPHGAADNRTLTQRSGTSNPAVVLTWGLLGAGKGIEWAIEALPHLADLPLVYRILGETHPRVLEREGEQYRDTLLKRVYKLGLTDRVQFDDRYLENAELQRLVREADVVLLPYDSREQVTSGVLIEAVTAGKPVVSTGFPHALELLSSGAGLIVERQNPVAIAAALRRILTEPGLRDAMAAEAVRIAPDLLWPAVAAQYRQLANEALSSESEVITA